MSEDECWMSARSSTQVVLLLYRIKLGQIIPFWTMPHKSHSIDLDKMYRFFLYHIVLINTIQLSSRAAAAQRAVRAHLHNSDQCPSSCCDPLLCLGNYTYRPNLTLYTKTCDAVRSVSEKPIYLKWYSERPLKCSTSLMSSTNISK